jgi:hypothetical protein
MAEMMIAFQCGACGFKLRAQPMHRVATDVVRRTCQRCHTRWQIVVTPTELPNGAGWLHRGDLTKLSAGPSPISVDADTD